MPRATARRLVARGVRLALMAGMLAPVLSARPARADRVPPTAAIARRADPEASGRRPFVRREASARRAEASEGAGGWWLGTAGVALALALFGGISLASRRYLPHARAARCAWSAAPASRPSRPSISCGSAIAS